MSADYSHFPAQPVRLNHPVSPFHCKKSLSDLIRVGVDGILTQIGDQVPDLRLRHGVCPIWFLPPDSAMIQKKSPREVSMITGLSTRSLISHTSCALSASLSKNLFSFAERSEAGCPYSTSHSKSVLFPASRLIFLIRCFP